MWKTIFDSVRGTSHKAAGSPCQDACRVFECSNGIGPFLALACSDGAGSASRSDLGSQTACDALVRFLQDETLDDLSDPLRAHETIHVICQRLRSELEATAKTYQIELRDLACTFLAAIVFDLHAVFFQIGDGAIIMRSSNGLEPVFWPQSGEYLNSTYFLTDSDYFDKLEVRVVNERISELALLTDGIERLALRVNERAAHEPFFMPLFDSLRAASNPDDLLEPLRQFLDSERVNDRTDDDKTLILAARCLAEQANDGAIL